jgi:hypothetical protein
VPSISTVTFGYGAISSGNSAGAAGDRHQLDVPAGYKPSSRPCRFRALSDLRRHGLPNGHRTSRACPARVTGHLSDRDGDGHFEIGDRIVRAHHPSSKPAGR